MYVVIVDFHLKPEHAASFHDAIRANARDSVADEPGCRQFDVCVDPNDDTKVFLYEIYDDHAAFEAHLRTAHFAVFDKSVEPWVASKSARKLTRMFP